MTPQSLFITALLLGVPIVEIGGAEEVSRSSSAPQPNHPPSTAKAPDPAELLQAMRDEAIDIDSPVARAKTWERKQAAGIAYAKQPGFRIKDVLPLLESSNYETRAVAVLALEGGGAKSVPILLDQMASDPHDIVRATCASVLGHIGDRRAFEPLLKLAEKIHGEKWDREWRVHWEAVGALGKFHDSRATPVLTQIIEDSIERPGYGFPLVAIESLATIGDARCVESLAELAEHSWPSRPNNMEGPSQDAARRITRVNNPAAIEVLGKLAQRPENNLVTGSATTALGNFHDERAAAILEAIIERYLASEARARVAIGSLRRSGIRITECKPFWQTVIDPKADRAARRAAADALTLTDEKAFAAFAVGQWKSVPHDADFETLSLIAASMAAHGDERLIPLWNDLFERVAPAVRRIRMYYDESGWHARGSPPPSFVALESFLRGMQEIGKSALGDLKSIRDREPDPRVKQFLIRTIDQIESGKPVEKRDGRH
jgi:HEAT repeat protein